MVPRRLGCARAADYEVLPDQEMCTPRGACCVTNDVATEQSHMSCAETSVSRIESRWDCDLADDVGRKERARRD